ncbi:unnamed protein product, partial [Urochloa humidicola]
CPFSQTTHATLEEKEPERARRRGGRGGARRRGDRTAADADGRDDDGADCRGAAGRRRQHHRQGPRTVRDAAAGHGKKELEPDQYRVAGVPPTPPTACITPPPPSTKPNHERPSILSLHSIASPRPQPLPAPP